MKKTIKLNEFDITRSDKNFCEQVGANNLMEGIKLNGFSINRINDLNAKTFYINSDTESSLTEKINKLIKENVKEKYKKNIFERRLLNDQRVKDLFMTKSLGRLNEEEEYDEELRNDVISKIKNNEWEPMNPKKFSRALSKSKHKKMLTDYSESELSKMKLFKLKDYNIGYALKQWEDGTYSEIVSVFNNEPKIKKIGDYLINSAIKNGGCHLDHFDGYLSDLYGKLGFVEYKRDEFNPEYDFGGEFEKKYGKKDIIYRTHKNCLK